MNTYAKFAIGAAAVVVVAVIGINLLPRTSGVGGSAPTVSPSLAPSPSPVPSPLPTSRPSPSPAAAVLPPAGDLAIGRHDLTLNGVSFSLAVPTSGWISNGDFGIDKGVDPETWDGGFIFWNNAPNGIYTDPCTRKEGPRVGPSAADLAAALATVPGTQAGAPSDVTVGGYPAKLVVVKIPEVAGCTAYNFYLWWAEELTGRYATKLGSTIKVWIVDVNGTLIQIDGEVTKDAPLKVGQEMQQIVDSIQFK